jgi:nitrogen fixation protein NifQ
MKTSWLSIEAYMRVNVDKQVGREAHYAYLMTFARGQGNDDALACMYASWMAGESILPANWGLSAIGFEELANYHFPGCGAFMVCVSPDADTANRVDEQAELIALMHSHRAGKSLSELWMASIVASACLGSDHLWQDLGLWCREDLSNLMLRNFPALAEKNVHNMKWKKFLYKQLCIAEGVYVCRAPSCDICVDYPVCFGGPED